MSENTQQRVLEPSKRPWIEVLGALVNITTLITFFLGLKDSRPSSSSIVGDAALAVLTAAVIGVLIVVGKAIKTGIDKQPSWYPAIQKVLKDYRFWWLLGTIALVILAFAPVIRPIFTPTLSVSSQHWQVLTQGIDAEVATGITVTSDGRLKGEFNGVQSPAKGDLKATYFTGFVPTHDWTAYSALSFDVEYDLPTGKPLEVTIATATGPDSCWNESTLWTQLAPGPNHLTFPLNRDDYKRCPDFNIGAMKGRDNVQRLNLIFLLKEPLSGTVYIRNLRLEK